MKTLETTLTQWKSKKAKSHMAPHSRWQCRYGEMRIDMFREVGRHDRYCLHVRRRGSKLYDYQERFDCKDPAALWETATAIIMGWLESGCLTPVGFQRVGMQPPKPIEVTFEDADGNPMAAEDVVGRFESLLQDGPLAEGRSRLRTQLAMTLRDQPRTDLNPLWTAVGLWSDQTFGSSGVRGPMACLRHMVEEAGKAVADPWNPDSYASMMLVLLDAARRADITLDELIQLTVVKLRVCRARKYPKPLPGDDSPCHYIREVEQTTSESAGPSVEDA